MKLTNKSDKTDKKDEQPYHLECNILKASTAEKNTNYFKAKQRKTIANKKLFLERANWRKKEHVKIC